MKDTINILCCTDDKYAPYYGIMLTSLFDNNKEEPFSIYVFTKGLKDITIKKYEKLTKSNHASLHVITINDEVLKESPIRKGDHVTLAAYYRLLASVLLPSIDKIIYFDGDIIINGKIRPLWETKIENYALAAVIDDMYNDEKRHETLCLPQEVAYFNSGVLLMNLNYWRSHHVLDRCLNCIKTKSDKLLFHDQDTLNIVLYKEIKYLPLTYNVQYGFLLKFRYQLLDEHVKKEIKEIMYQPVVIHFSGPPKPWEKRNRHPFVKYFLYYMKHSLWNDISLKGKFTIIENIRHSCNMIVWKLHLKKEFNSYIIERQDK